VTQSVDVAVVGAGITGLAHAWSAARRGLTVALFDRHPQAQGASVRNFGIVLPIGQPAGDRRELAMQGRRWWKQLSESAGIWTNECGSLHLAYRRDELAVLEEFRDQSAECDVRMLTPAEVFDRSAAANPEGLLGALWSSSEMCINPRAAIAKLPLWLNETFDVQLHFATPIVNVDYPALTSSEGRSWHAERIVIAGGSDFETLFPAAYEQLAPTRCKLQMMQTAAQPDGWRMGPLVAGGLTLQHYQSFASCPSLPALKNRIAEETPEINRYGIHVLASQNDAGEMLLGDSHEYDDDISIFDKSEIDDLIVRELRRLIRLPSFEITRRWHGIYANVPTEGNLTAEPQPGVRIAVAPGGSGMTLSFGLAEQLWNEWSGTLPTDKSGFIGQS